MRTLIKFLPAAQSARTARELAAASCDYETWYHAREVFAVLALSYLVLHASHR